MTGEEFRVGVYVTRVRVQGGCIGDREGGDHGWVYR